MKPECKKVAYPSRRARLAARRSGGVLILVVILIVLLALMLTIPSQEKHEAAIKEAIRTAAQKGGGWSAVGAALGLTDLGVHLMPLEYKKTIFFSTTSYDGKLLSIGVMGYVHVLH